MSHLSSDELIDLVDGRGHTRAALHLERCERCRERHRTLADALAAARSVDVPEPSPLFWDHLSARVREAVATGPAPSRGWPWSFGFGVPVVATAVLALILVSSLAVWRNRALTSVATDVVVTVPLSVVPEGEQAGWDLMLSMAEDVAWEDLSGQGLTRVGAADEALQDLTPGEREELARALRAELEDGRSS